MCSRSPATSRPCRPRSIAAVKRVVDASLVSFDDALVDETNAFGELTGGGAHVEPMQRFLAAGGQTREGELDRTGTRSWRRPAATRDLRSVARRRVLARAAPSTSVRCRPMSASTRATSDAVKRNEPGRARNAMLRACG